MTTTPAPVAWRIVPVEPTYEMQDAARNSAAKMQMFKARIAWYAMLRASPAPDLEGLRERVARVVDPRSFEGLAYASERLPAEPRSKYFTDLARLSRDGVDAALAKADAVLALIFTPEGEVREYHRD
ncbi:hypothetical protein [Brevundimonas sp.]|uniref:hypothetical protein n=1 Tax=Brevundimonas sp. TaxID=1871086 RepID=UPI002D36EF36|nr:hypothetical protein [Brevundimonas sp.]HYC66688.1 hypothetical protein [Brevundimonas sp.]